MKNPFDEAQEPRSSFDDNDFQKMLTYTLGPNTAGPVPTTAWQIFMGPDEPRSNDKSLLQEWILRFMSKQRDYRDSADDLGAPGQYAELHRKMGKLKRALWDGEELVGEPAEEVLQDLIGHCFLAIRHLRQNNYGGKPTK